VPTFGTIFRLNLIRALRSARWQGTYSGGNRQYMTLGTQRLIIPNAHGGDISRNLLGRLLVQANISREEWEKL